MSPVVVGGIATAVGGALLVGVGIAAGRWQARREWAAHRDYTAVLEANLALVEAEARYLQAAVEELREGVGRVWDQAFKAGRETDEWTLITREAERRQREHGGGRS